MVGTDPHTALPMLYGILERYAEATEPGEQRIADVVRGLIAELEAELGES